MSFREELDSVLKFFSGGCAGVIAKTLVAPIDRVKFLFMGTVRDFNLHSLKFEIKRIKVQEGVRSYWKGNLVQLMRIFPYSGIVIST